MNIIEVLEKRIFDAVMETGHEPSVLRLTQDEATALKLHFDPAHMQYDPKVKGHFKFHDIPIEVVS